jgi:GPH family glycoside/pentoside/hexuronide:cation symporter
MPWAMIPDTVEYGYLQTGERMEGGYYGVWTLFSKAAQGLLALPLVGLILQVTGYIPEVAQTPLAQLGIRLMFGPVAGVFFVAAAVFLAFYPLSEQRYAELQEKIKAMEKERKIQPGS